MPKACISQKKQWNITITAFGSEMKGWVALVSSIPFHRRQMLQVGLSLNRRFGWVMPKACASQTNKILRYKQSFIYRREELDRFRVLHPFPSPPEA